LGHRQCVAHDDDGQSLLDGFTDAARPGLADEKIAELHVAAHLARETEDQSRGLGRQAAQFLCQSTVVPADQDQLRAAEAARDTAHGARSMAAEHHEPRGPRGIESQPAQFRLAIPGRGTVEIWVDDHSRGGMDTARITAHRQRLRDGARGSADRVLRLTRFDPEMRRKVSEVGQHRGVGNRRRQCRRGLVHRAIEIRNERDDQVGAAATPVHAQLLDQRPVAQADQRLQYLQFLRESQRPAACQPLVVVILRIHAGGLAKHALRVEHFEQIHRPHMPGAILLEHDLPQRQSRGTMPAAGVEINEIDRLQMVSRTRSRSCIQRTSSLRHQCDETMNPVTQPRAARRSRR